MNDFGPSDARYLNYGVVLTIRGQLRRTTVGDRLAVVIIQVENQVFTYNIRGQVVPNA